ncbi:MAG: DUF371 domain-containing protein [Desulfurococcaceae archaeon]|jgi:hypothetical protein
MPIHEVVTARGHPNIKATHKSTLEITKDREVTPRGDCIVGVAADKAPADFSEEFKAHLRDHDALLVVVLEAGDIKDIVLAHGHPGLLLTDTRRLIIRKSTYIEPATIGINASKSSAELKRELITLLKDPETVLTAHLYVLRLDEIASIYAGSRRVL